MNTERIKRLQDPAVFPTGSGEVEVLQTHLSVVCLAGDSAFKFKKPIRLPFADFSTLEKREHFCEEELRLNRRLCPEIYEEVVPLRREEDGTLRIGPGEGKVIDYAVKMRRLPAERMLDVMLQANTVGVADLEEIAQRMTRFHHDAAREPETTKKGDPDRLRGFAIANFEETRPAVGRIFPARLHASLEKRAKKDFERCLPVLRERADSGHVIDGHGDLHARNICLTDPVAIYDCIEFNPEFRCSDVATEHAFLIMDLRFRGHPELAASYFDAVEAATGDREMRSIMPMLVRYRAMVRAKVSAIAAGENELSESQREEAADTARRYLRLAAVSAIEEDGPAWLIFCGLPASGKSSIAKALANASGGTWPVFSSDQIRKELAGIPSTDPLPESFYSPEFSRRTYDEMRSRATGAADKSRIVILDANFRGREERALAREAAEAAGARLVIFRVDTDEETVIARLDRRAINPDAESDADEAVYQKLKSACEPPEPAEADRLITVSGATEATEAADELLASML
ncbi:MAG: AAA family ATPase [Verrucomicrobiales bacterium]|nr:AAA family ATPase [Verrucomicrobiales bacterium]